MIRTYSELITIPDFIGRFEYLKLGGQVGKDTFGFNRYLNQIFYNSKEWERVRRQIIVRDCGCDLGIPDLEILRGIYIHHLNPITVEDIQERREICLDPEFLICTSYNTHNAIHYGDKNLLCITEPTIRKPNDTIPWRT
ncbi:MAG: hypothetical protein E7571_05405 [Ruminococcaceae bacterium]|nr:hypothetical protein [Oscillospiraceae bacterium]